MVDYLGWISTSVPDPLDSRKNGWHVFSWKYQKHPNNHIVISPQNVKGHAMDHGPLDFHALTKHLRQKKS